MVTVVSPSARSTASAQLGVASSGPAAYRSPTTNELQIGYDEEQFAADGAIADVDDLDI